MVERKVFLFGGRAGFAVNVEDVDRVVLHGNNTLTTTLNLFAAHGSTSHRYLYVHAGSHYEYVKIEYCELLALTVRTFLVVCYGFYANRLNQFIDL